MKILVIISLIVFSFSVTSMEQPKQRKRRSELESLTNQETTIDKFVCDYGCGYVSSYKAVQAHERKEHIKKQNIQDTSTHTDETLDIPHEKKTTLLPVLPEKKIIPIPDQPYQFKPFDRDVLTAEDRRQLTLAPFIAVQTIHERNEQRKQSKLEKEKKEKANCNIPTSWTCSECSKSFIAKNRYFCHLIMIHNYQFPAYAKDKAYLKRIERLMNTPSNEPVIID